MPLLKEVSTSVAMTEFQRVDTAMPKGMPFSHLFPTKHEGFNI